MSNREIFIDKLRQLSKEEMLERYIALLNTEKLTDCVADLETKLAQSKMNESFEKEKKENALKLIEDLQQEQIKEMQEHQEAMELADKTITSLVEDNRASQEWYKKQLAEKEEEINMLEEHKFYADNTIQAYADKCKKADQDKISFCIEQLEKVKEYIKTNLMSFQKVPIIQEINNQIKQLKEQQK